MGVCSTYFWSKAFNFRPLELIFADLNYKNGGFCYLQDNIRLAGDCKAIEVSILHGNPLFKEPLMKKCRAL